ncbi:TIR domain-containing protein [Sphingomicrobium nitratireducens]|uniref:TIR domain-containing protein n=1 Tax=Sphingomicrobium nitratireducens TaxID=2964666 RepID=UPI00223FA4EF|nr:TIR domain-containing protein [Sphingomicrobium nitratireducens]
MALADIFLSYSSADRDRVSEIATALEAAGHSVWWDRQLDGGDEFSKDIEKALTEAKAVVVCWSPAAADSHWVRDEASYARDAHSLVPISLDGNPPPLGFRQVQAIDFSHWPERPGALERLESALAKRGLGNGQAVQPERVAAAGGRPRWLVPAILLILVAVAATAYMMIGGGTASRVEASNDRPVIAVLPFRALSNGDDDAYFAEGLTEELTNRLATLPELITAASSSTAFFRGKDVPPAEIAAQLNAAYLVTGSIRRSGEKVRVSAQLIDARDGTTMWADTYDSSVADALSVQADIAEKVAGALDVLLDGDKRAQMEAVGAKNPEAYIELAKGNEIFERAHADGTYEDLEEANVHYARAFDLAPNLWQAPLAAIDHWGHVVLGYAQGFPSRPGDPTAADAQRRIRELANQAESAHPDGHAPLAQLVAVATSDDWSGLQRQLQQIKALDCPPASWAPNLTLPYGRVDEYGDTFLRKEKCAVLDSGTWYDIGKYWLAKGDGAKALVALDRDADLRGAGPVIEFHRVVALLMQDRVSDARVAAGRIDQEDFRKPPTVAMLNAFTGEDRPIPPFAEGGNVYTKIWVAALTGDRETANRVAAEVDARPSGPFLLVLLGSDCLCGAPFDLDATPNLKRQLKQGGLQWPPYDPLGLQAKIAKRKKG